MEPISMAAMALPQLANMVTSFRQSREAKKLKPRGVSNQLLSKERGLRQEANAGTDTIHASQDAEIDQNVNNAVGQARRTSKDSGNVLNTIAAVTQNANKAKRQSLADYLRRRREAGYRQGQAQSEIAREKFANDQMYAQAKSQLLGASQVNTANSLENMSTNLLAYLNQ